MPKIVFRMIASVRLACSEVPYGRQLMFGSCFPQGTVPGWAGFVLKPSAKSVPTGLGLIERKTLC